MNLSAQQGLACPVRFSAAGNRSGSPISSWSHTSPGRARPSGIVVAGRRRPSHCPPDYHRAVAEPSSRRFASRRRQKPAQSARTRIDPLPARARLALQPHPNGAPEERSRPLRDGSSTPMAVRRLGRTPFPGRALKTCGRHENRVAVRGTENQHGPLCCLGSVLVRASRPFS